MSESIKLTIIKSLKINRLKKLATILLYEIWICSLYKRKLHSWDVVDKTDPKVLPAKEKIPRLLIVLAQVEAAKQLQGFKK